MKENPINFFIDAMRYIGKYLFQWSELMPIARLENRDEFMLLLKYTKLQRINSIEQSLLHSANSESFLLDNISVD